MEQNRNEDKKRGGCLTAFLIVFMVLMGISAVTGLFAGDNVLMKGAPTWAITAAAVFRIVVVAGCIGTLIWKKWGVYLFAVGYTALTVVNIFTVSGGLKVVSLIGSVIGLAVVLGILAFLIKPVWKHMA